MWSFDKKHRLPDMVHDLRCWSLEILQPQWDHNTSGNCTRNWTVVLQEIVPKCNFVRKPHFFAGLFLFIYITLTQISSIKKEVNLYFLKHYTMLNYFLKNIAEHSLSSSRVAAMFPGPQEETQHQIHTHLVLGLWSD